MPRSGLSAAFAFTVVALASAQALILWPAALDVPLSAPLAWMTLVASLGLAAWSALRWRGLDAGGPGDAPAGRTAADPSAAAARAVSATSWLAVLVALGFGAWTWAALWRLVWARPVYDWDGLYYHVPAMNAWAAAGRVHWIPALHDLPFANGYPMATEALGFLVHRLSGSSRLADGGNLFYWPLAALALAVIAACLGARGPWRFAPAGLIAIVPGWVVLSATCYVDPGFAAAAAAALAAGLLWTHAAPTHGASGALLFGAAGGLMIGTKGQGLPFFALALLAALIARRARGVATRALLAHGVLAVVAAFAAGGYWALRNVVWSGNPIFPIELKLGAKVLVPGYDTAALLDGNMPGWLRAWPAWLRVPAAWAGSLAPLSGHAVAEGLGRVWIAAGLPALLIAPFALRRDRARLGAVVLLVAIGVAWLAVQPAPWWARMTLWLHALGLPALAVVLGRATRGRRIALAFAAPLVLLVVLASGAAETLGALDAERAKGREADGTYRSSAAYMFPGLEEACPDFMAAGVIGRGPWSRFGTLLGGVLAQPLDARRIVPIEGVDAVRLREAGIEWVVWDEASGPAPASLRAAALDSCAHRPQPDQRFLMLRIRP